VKKYLLTPGPTPIPPEVSSKEGLPVLHHRTSEFGAFFAEVIDGLKYVFQTQNDVLLLTSSGTGAMEGAVANLLSPGDTALVASTGVFGDRWTKILQTYGMQPVVVRTADGQAVSPAQVEEALKKNPQVKAVFTQLTETSTGVVNDIKALGAIVEKTPAVFVVDAISGLGGQELQTDAWLVDLVVAGSQKGLMTAPGLAMMSVSKKAWALIETSKSPRFYFDFRKMRDNIPKKQTPFTPGVTLVVAMAEALRQIRQDGLENIMARTAWLAQATRAGIQALGLTLFAKTPCNVLTSVVVPAGIDGKKIVKTLREDYGVSIAGGQGDLEGKIIRLAHMGYIERFDIIVGISALEMILKSMGYPVELGRGVGAVEKALLSGAPAPAANAPTAVPVGR
jgi:aspartate aminotransferase-like enzyme